MPLETYLGARRGEVAFDGDVLIPALHERDARYADGSPWQARNLWGSSPWMSHTPMEVFSLRGGTRRAKGSVVVAGLGLGQQLIDVSQRAAVKQLTLVECSQELVDWIMPRISATLTWSFPS